MKTRISPEWFFYTLALSPECGKAYSRFVKASYGYTYIMLLLDSISLMPL